MNYFTLFLSFIFSLGVTAQTVITYNTGTNLSSTNGGLSNYCGDNEKVGRNFDLSDFSITESIDLKSIDIGVFQLDVAQTITVNIYESDGSFTDNSSPGALLGTEDFMLDVVNYQTSGTPELKGFNFTTPITVGSGVTHIFVEYVVPGPIANFKPAEASGTGEPGYYDTNGCGGPYGYTSSLFGSNYEYYIAVNANETTLSVDDVLLIDSELNAYPNPTNGLVNIKLSSDNAIKSVSAYNILGSSVNVRASDNQIDFSDLTSGIYILKIDTTKGLISKKLIKM